MKLVALEGTITGETYYALEVEVEGTPVLLRLPAYQYSHLQRTLKCSDKELGEKLFKAVKES